VSQYVVDAAAAAEYLLRTALGVRVAGVIEDASLIAPELLDVEVPSVLRRAVLRRELGDFCHASMERWNPGFGINVSERLRRTRIR
jgi:predicted nucleic acid-binding protein